MYSNYIPENPKRNYPKILHETNRHVDLTLGPTKEEKTKSKI